MVSDPIRVEIFGREGAVAALVFLPDEPPPNLPLLLFGHGAHLSKDDEIMQMLARGFTSVPAAVALMDCPGHGERRPPGQSDDEFDRAVRARMADTATYPQLVDEWNAIAKTARAAVPSITGPNGYVGFSMGSIFGLSIVASLDDVTAAVFALGGLVPADRPGSDVINGAILDGVTRLGERDVLMLNMTHDDSFPMPGAIHVLEAIPGPRRMGVWVGGHADIQAEAVSMAIRFLRRALAP